MPLLPSEQNAQNCKPFFNRLILIAGILVGLIGLGGVIGIALGIPWLTSYMDSTVRLALPTAIALICLGLAIKTILDSHPYEQSPQWFWLIRYGSLLGLGGTGLYWMVRYLSYPGFDWLNFEHYGLYPVAFSTTVLLLLCAIVLFVFLVRQKSEIAVAYGVCIPALIILNAGILGVLGHFYRLPLLYGMRTSLPAAIAFIITGLIILIGTLPFRGLLLPVLSENRKARAMAMLSFAFGFGELFFGINSIAIALKMTESRELSGLGPQLQHLLTIGLIGANVVSILISVIGLRATRYYSQAMFFARQQEEIAAQENVTRQIVQTIHGTLDLEEAFLRIAEMLGRYLQADRCFICRYDEKKRTLTPPTQEYLSGPDISSMIRVDSDLWESITEFAGKLCTEHSGPTDFHCQVQELSSQAQVCLRDTKVQSGLACPVFYRGECYAIIFVHQVKEGRVWTPTEKEVLSEVAEQAGVAIYQSEIYHLEKKTREDLQFSETRFRMLTEGVQDYAIYLEDTEGRITSWNEGAQRIYGYTAEDVLGKPFSIFFPAEEVESGLFDRELKTARETGRFEVEGWRVRKDGSRFWANVVISALSNDQGELIGYSSITRDITEHRQAERQLANRERQQRAVAELGARALAGIDVQEMMDQVVKLVAETLDVPFTKVLEYRPEGSMIGVRAVYGFKPDLVGQQFPLADESQAAFTLAYDEPLIVHDIYKDIRLGPTGLHYDYGLISGLTAMIHGKEGPFGILQADCNTTRNFTPDDTAFLQSMANLLSVVIERKALEAELENYTRKLTESNQDLEHFATVASHDLQAPMRKALMFSDMVIEKNKMNLDLETLDWMERVRRSLTSMQHLITDLLALSKVSRSDRPFQEVDISTVVQRVLTMLDDQIRERHARITVDAHDSVVADELQLEQLLQNLIGNALKYQQADREPEIAIQSGCVAGEFCYISVQDNGIGIPPDQHERIFQPFERLHGKTSPYEGTGVGLAICKRIAERHGGEITVESEPGKGSRFTVRLPYRQTQQELEARLQLSDQR